MERFRLLPAFRLIAAALLFVSAVASGGVTHACICDEICHPGEVYSDEHEMCVDEAVIADEETPTS